jgi:hypothetical protein
VRLVRFVDRIAAVFPKNPEIDALLEATAAFKDMDEATSKKRLSKFFDAVEGIRQKALIVDVSVLSSSCLLLQESPNITSCINNQLPACGRVTGTRK